jgi:hypothetical protein
MQQDSRGKVASAKVASSLQPATLQLCTFATANPKDDYIMKWRWTFRSVIIVVLLSSVALISQLHTGTAQAAPGRREEVILVHFKPTTSLAERDAIIAEVGGELLSWLEPLHVAQVRLQQNGDGVRQAAAQLAFTAAVELVEADTQVMGAVIPNDPDITDPYKVYAPQLLNLFVAWGYTTGSSEVTIAVLDTGIAHAHPELPAVSSLATTLSIRIRIRKTSTAMARMSPGLPPQRLITPPAVPVSVALA